MENLPNCSLTRDELANMLDQVSKVIRNLPDYADLLALSRSAKGCRKTNAIRKLLTKEEPLTQSEACYLKKLGESLIADGDVFLFDTDGPLFDGQLEDNLELTEDQLLQMDREASKLEAMEAIEADRLAMDPGTFPDAGDIPPQQITPPGGDDGV